MQLLAEAGEAAGTLGRVERPGECGVALHALPDGAADIARVAAAPVGRVEEVLDRVAQLCLLLDLVDRTAGRVHVGGLLLDGVAAQVAHAVGTGIALAVAEEPVDAVVLRELAEVLRGRDVDVAHQDQVGGEALVFLDDGEPGEVQAGESAEVEHGAVRDPVAHRREQALELGAGARADGRDDRQRLLVRHVSGRT